MSNIHENLQKILHAVWGKDVRQAIHDAIHDCYEDGSAGSTDLIAREEIEELEATKATRIELAEETADRLAEVAVERGRIDNLVTSGTGVTNATKRTETTLFSASVPCFGNVSGYSGYFDIEDAIENYDYIKIRYNAFGRTGIVDCKPADISASGTIGSTVFHWSEIQPNWETISLDNPRTVFRHMDFSAVNISSGNTHRLSVDAVVFGWNGDATSNGKISDSFVISWDSSKSLYVASGFTGGIYSIIGVKYTDAGVDKDTELTDIRTGADGTVYQTAGGAVRGQIEDITNRLNGIESNFGDEYDNTATYAVGDRRVHEGVWYECNTPISTAEEWTEAHWDKVSLADITDQVAQNTSDISSLKEDLNAKIDNPSDGEEGQILTNDGQGGAVWSNVGTPTDAQVDEAVETWLEDHPEATTTVEDGSLTEVKFSDALKKATVKEYVTPEMFGAVGDGNTDDTQAIRDMLATDAKYYIFSKPVYKITDSIDFTRDWSTIVFNNTQIKVIHTGSDLVEYGVGFKAAMLKTIGLLRVVVARHAYIGIWMQGVHGSAFDDIFVEGAIIWGLYMYDKSGGGNNTVTINCFRAGSCGITYFAKGKYVSATEMAITDIDYSGYSSFTDAQKLKVFGGDYRQIVQIVDDSGYSKTGVQNRIVYNTRLDQPITLDPEDLTKGTYVTGGNIYNIQSDYADGDNGRNIAIPIGGGAKFGSSASEGGLSVRRMSITSCSKALDMGYAYGGEIGSFMCESCTLMIVTRFICWWLTIGYLYTEAIGNLLQTNDKKSLFLVCNDSNTTVSVNIATSKFDLSNVAVLNQQAGVGIYRNPLIQISENIYKSTSFNVSADQFFGQTINEYSPRVLTYNASQLSTVATYTPFTLDITNPNDYKNGFSPFTIYVRNTSGNVNAQKLRIGIKANALNQGYSIYGAVNNILTVDGSSLGNNYKVTVMLFGKVFYVTAEALNYVDNT